MTVQKPKHKFWKDKNTEVGVYDCPACKAEVLVPVQVTVTKERIIRSYCPDCNPKPETVQEHNQKRDMRI
jgi:hypothetical protein